MSDDLRPPSLRDTNNLTDVVRHHGLVLAKLAPGLFGGRSRIPDPIDLADDLEADGDPGADGDTDEPEWWDEDRYTVTSSGAITWVLTYVPVVESLFIHWFGVALIRGIDWTLGDDGQTVTIPDLGFHIDDVLSAQYQFLDVIDDDPPPPVPASLSLVGYTTATVGGAIALPAGTQAGDLIVVAAANYAPSSAPSTADSRILVQHDDVNTSAIGGAPNGGGVLTAFGVEDGSGSAVTVSSTGDTAIVLAVFAYTGDLDSLWTPLADAVADGHNYPVDLPAAAQMGVALLAGHCGTASSPFGADSSGDWTGVAFQTGTNVNKATAYIAYTSGPHDGVFHGLSTPSIWSAMSVGIEEG